MITAMTIDSMHDSAPRTDNTTATAVRAAIYVRISLDREGAGLGVQRQEEDCRAYCERRGWNVAEVYCDNDVSASSNKPRPEWQRLLSDIRDGRINAIVVWHVDRMTRKPRELEDVIDLHEKYGVQLGTVTGDVDLANPTGRMIARMLGAAARHEAEHKGERQRRQRLQAAQAGQPHKTGRRPFGYLDDFVTPHPTEAPYVAEAATRALAGESLISIARWLNDAGMTTTLGNPFNYGAVRQILTRARYSGRREVGCDKHRLGEIVAVDCWPAIISVEQSDRLRATVGQRKRDNTSTASKHLLSGLLTCSLCGASMAGAKKIGGGKSSTYMSYRCNVLSRRASEDGGCGRVNVHMQHVDTHVVDLVLEAIESPELAERLAQSSEIDPVIIEQIKRDEQELIDIAQDRADGAITRGEWAAMRETIDARLKLNRSKMQRATNTNALSLLDGEGSLSDRWARLNLSQRRAVISAVLTTVKIAPSRGGRLKGGAYFDVERIEPLWRV